MRKSICKRAMSIALVAAMAVTSLYIAPKEVSAENPIIQTIYTADPAPFVIGDTLYLCTTHDEVKETKSSEWNLMLDWRMFKTKDMVNWTDLGQIAHLETFDRTDPSKQNIRAWAPQIVMRPIKEDGVWKDKYFMYAPFSGTKIDVAVADNPEGPYEDATTGKFLIDGTWDGGNIDPTVYIDDHGNPEDKENYDAYLYWGNPYFRYCKLTDDMLDIDPDTDGDGVLSDEENAIDPRFTNNDNKILGKVRPGLHSFNTYGDEGLASFGEPTQGMGKIDKTKDKFPAEPESAAKQRCAFEEGPWVYKHEDGNPETDDYFLVFVGGRTGGETIEYSTAPTPLGPWTYGALLLAREGQSCLHPGVAEFGGKNYLFYLNSLLVAGDGSNRSVCVKEFQYDEDNKIVRETPEDYETSIHEKPLMVQGKDGVKSGYSFFSVDPIGTLNPYELNQAETICWESNLNGPEGGFNGTQNGVKTKAKAPCTDIDSATNREAFWKSAAYNGVAVCDIDNDDYIRVSNVDFGDYGPIKFDVSAACGVGLEPVNTTVDDKGIMIPNPDADTVGGDIEIWVDYDDEDAKTKIGSVTISDTGSTNEYKTFSTDVDKVTGVHNLTFVFKGNDDAKLFNLDTWQFTTIEVTPTPSPSASVIPSSQPTATVTPTPTVAPSAAPQVVSPSPVVTQPAKAVTLSKPVIKKLKALGKKLSISYKKVKNADGYQIYIANKKNGKYTLKLTVKKKITCTINKLKKGHKYFVKLRAYNKGNGKKVYSKFSTVKKIKM